MVSSAIERLVFDWVRLPNRLDTPGISHNAHNFTQCFNNHLSFLKDE